MLVIDWFSLSVIFAFSVAGFFNGFAKEGFSTAAWILSIIGAWYFGPLLFPFVSPYLGNPEINSITSFAQAIPPIPIIGILTTLKTL